jgi:hypothetical protein
MRLRSRAALLLIGAVVAPGGEKDEACAQAGVAKIRDRVAATSP